VSRRLLGLSVLLVLGAGRASAEVRSLQLQIRMNCPYGLAG
jgi:hypothetical protein